MVELADAQDLGSCAARRVGSTPTTRIIKNRRWFVKNQRLFCYYYLTYYLTFIFISTPTLTNSLLFYSSNSTFSVPKLELIH